MPEADEDKSWEQVRARVQQSPDPELVARAAARQSIETPENPPARRMPIAALIVGAIAIVVGGAIYFIVQRPAPQPVAKSTSPAPPVEAPKPAPAAPKPPAAASQPPVPVPQPPVAAPKPPVAAAKPPVAAPRASSRTAIIRRDFKNVGVWSKPSADSPRIATLTGGVNVEKISENGPWMKVRARVAGKLIEGWIRTASTER